MSNSTCGRAQIQADNGTQFTHPELVQPANSHASMLRVEHLQESNTHTHIYTQNQQQDANSTHIHQTDTYNVQLTHLVRQASNYSLFTHNAPSVTPVKRKNTHTYKINTKMPIRQTQCTIYPPGLPSQLTHPAHAQCSKLNNTCKERTHKHIRIKPTIRCQ